MIVHSFSLGDVEDPMLYAADPLYQWQITEAGQWVLEHALESPVFHIQPCLDFMGSRCVVTANFSPADESYYLLKWGF